MKSNYEQFFEANSFAIIGNSTKMNFPELSYKGLKKLGKEVYPIDSKLNEIEGEKVYRSLSDLPKSVERIIIEAPKEDSLSYVKEADSLGIKDIWFHMKNYSDEAIEYAQQKGINVRYGTCAVMYVTPGLTFHSIHKVIMKIFKKY